MAPYSVHGVRQFSDVVPAYDTTFCRWEDRRVAGTKWRVHAIQFALPDDPVGVEA